jgi:hypothetical protein
MLVLIDDELFEVDAECVDEEPDGSGFWLAFDDEDDESFYEYVEVDEADFE